MACGHRVSFEILTFSVSPSRAFVSGASGIPATSLKDHAIPAWTRSRIPVCSPFSIACVIRPIAPPLVPKGFQIDNTAQAVLATGPGDIAIRFDGVSEKRQKSLANYISSGWVSGLDASSIKSTKINGLDAATARATADEWDFDVTVIRVKNRIYRLLTAAPRGSKNLEQVAMGVRNSFRKMTASETASLQPLRIQVVKVRPGDTVNRLAGRMRGTNRRLELFRLINALSPGASLSAGQEVKIVSDR